MKDPRRITALTLIVGSLLWACAAWADDDLSFGEDGAEESPQREEQTGQEASDPTPAVDLPHDPGRRVQMAEQAFHYADFELLRPLLEPLLESTEPLADPDLRHKARRLLAVGLFFEAQQVADATARTALLGRARGYFLDILREDPEDILDPMLFPASVVELFEDVRQQNAAELEVILASRQRAPREQGFELQTLYIEREVRSNHLVLNFFPLGIGQFQNRSPIKGTLFAVGQLASLTVNVLSYYMIERLRGPDGKFDTGGDTRGGNYALALGWRNAQFGALAAFGAVYGWSIIDGLVHFEPFYIHIRTLDEAPPELAPTMSGQPRAHGLGWSLRFRW